MEKLLIFMISLLSIVNLAVGSRMHFAFVTMRFVGVSLILATLSCSDDEIAPPQYSEPKGAVNAINFFSSLQDTVPVRLGQYRYDLKGRLVEVDYFDYPDSKYQSIHKEYDSHLEDRISKEISYVYQDTKKEVGVTSIHEYEQALLAKTSFHDSEGNLFSEHRFTYDDAGNQVKISFFQPIQGSVGFHNYEYREGRLFREFHYAMDNSVVRAYEYHYDSQGSLEKRVFLADQLTYQEDWVRAGIDQEYYYDEQNRLVKIIQYAPWWGYRVDEITTYEYY